MDNRNFGRNRTCHGDVSIELVKHSALRPHPTVRGDIVTELTDCELGSDSLLFMRFTVTPMATARLFLPFCAAQLQESSNLCAVRVFKTLEGSCILHAILAVKLFCQLEEIAANLFLVPSRDKVFIHGAFTDALWRLLRCGTNIPKISHTHSFVLLTASATYKREGEN